jgi:hypothetical protein
MYKCQDNIKMDFKDVEYQGMDWSHVAQERDHWQILLDNTVNFRDT